MTTDGDALARVERLRRHKLIIIVASGLAAVVAGFWHIYLHLSIPVAYFRRPYPIRGDWGLYFACVTMWPFLPFCIKAVRSISSKVRDLILSLVALVAGLAALCYYDQPGVSGQANYFEYFLVEVWIMTLMTAIPHFLMDGLED